MPPTLSDEAKRQLIESRLAAFAIDSFGHELNKQVAVAQGDDTAVAVADLAIQTIAIASATYQAELDALLIADIIQEP